ncbi:MAG: hypothetical protein RTU09_05380 [Candidatus Thorarchaeota archaeon]
MSSTRVRVHRYTAWLLAIFSLAIIATGYSLARGWIVDIYLISSLHRVLEVFFIGFLIIHVTITLVHFKITWRRLLDGVRNKKGTSIHLLRLVQRVSAWLIVIFALLVILPGLNGYIWFATVFSETIPFGWHRIYDAFLAVLIILHVGVGLKFLSIRRGVRKQIANLFIIGLTVSLLVTVAFLNAPQISIPLVEPPPGNDTIINPGTTTLPVGVTTAHASVDGVKYGFNWSAIETTRPDLFTDGHFSMFDVLVDLSNRGLVSLEYHFNESMNTHVIDSMNGMTNWWYRSYYSGGWLENNVFRMDHHPWKEGTTLQFMMLDANQLERIHQAFEEEVARLEANGGTVIIPHVEITTPHIALGFYNVTVTAHDLRDDLFQSGVITAIDVIMSLGDQGLITYGLQWYDTIGTAEIVRNYWVDNIDGEQASGTCGFVYDTGSLEFYGFGGNHIHIPMDARMLNSPEYLRMFWICL